jgi:uncharacterized membrane protein YedE/YeeE
MPLALSSLLAGILFGLGLAVSQMTNPLKVLAFLDVAGAWDPSLAIVMIAAVAMFFAAFRAAQARPAPFFAGAFQFPTRTDIDAPLVVGSVLFGAGWGLAGLCPGPAITALVSGQRKTFLFLGAMLAGMLIYRLTTRRHS